MVYFMVIWGSKADFQTHPNLASPINLNLLVFQQICFLDGNSTGHPQTSMTWRCVGHVNQEHHWERRKARHSFSCPTPLEVPGIRLQGTKPVPRFPSVSDVTAYLNMFSHEFSCFITKPASKWLPQKSSLSFYSYVVAPVFLLAVSFKWSLRNWHLAELGLRPCSDRLFMPAKRSLWSPAVVKQISNFQDFIVDVPKREAVLLVCPANPWNIKV